MAEGNLTRETTTGVSLHVKWFGTWLAVEDGQNAAMAARVGASANRVKSQRAILDTNHPAWRALVAKKNAVRKHFKLRTLPFIKPGVRLVRRERFGGLYDSTVINNEQMQGLSRDLAIVWPELLADAQREMGDLFNRGDYPETPVGAFEFSLSSENLELPDYMRELHPEVYRMLQRQTAEQFAAAAAQAEAAFTTSMTEVVGHLAERLRGGPDGRPHIFRDSAVENVQQFLRDFRALNIESGPALTALVARAESLLTGVTPEEIRTMADLRATVTTQLTEIDNQLQGMTVAMPTRRIRRMAE